MKNPFLETTKVFFYSKVFFCLRVSGKDAESFLQNLITNDIRKLTQQKFLSTIVLNTSGKVCFFLYIQKKEEDYWLFGSKEDKQALQKHLEFFHILEEIEITEEQEVRVYYILSCSRLDKTFFVAEEIEVLRQTEQYFLVMPLAEKKFLDYIKKQGLVEMREEEFEETRAFFSIAQKPEDYDQKRLPQEAALRSEISFQKGCFVGQEAVARLEHKGKIVRILCQIISKQFLEKGEKMKNQNQNIGGITSSCPYPYEDNYYALGYVKTSALEQKEFFSSKGEPIEKIRPLEKLKQ